MIRKYFLKTLLILLLSATFILTLPWNGICIDKSLKGKKIDLSQYGGIRNSTFIAYKYDFGVRKGGSLQFVITPTNTGFTLDWNEEYPLPEGDGTAQYLAFDYEVTDQGLFEKNISHYLVNNNVPGYPSRGGLAYISNYRDPPNGIPPNPPGPGNFKPLLTFPYAVVEVGYMWGDAFIEKRAMETFNNYPRVYQYAILGLEDVAVPAGTFKDCVKIARFRGNQPDRIAWYAKGIGLVKMIYAQEEHSHSISNVQYQFPGYNRAFVLESLDD